MKRHGRHSLGVGYGRERAIAHVFKMLSPAVQKQTIGPMRLELYNSGKIKGLGDLVIVENGKARLLLLKELGAL